MSKAIVFSDLHGNGANLGRLLSRAGELGAARAYFAGDMGLGDPEVRKILFERSLPMLCVGGNCDSPWDWAKAGMPLAPLFLSSVFNGREVFLTHGHVCRAPEDAGVERKPGMIIINGHTHLPLLRAEGGGILLNPGSLGRPRGRWGASYAVIGEDFVRIEELGSGKAIASISF